MTNIIRSGALALICCSIAACGASGTTADTADDAAEAQAELEWTRALLRKLDPTLRERVRSGDGSRLAVKVFFRERVGDEELMALLLSRVGDHYVGNVPPETLHRIASRDDVERIVPVRDIGY